MTHRSLVRKCCVTQHFWRDTSTDADHVISLNAMRWFMSTTTSFDVWPEENEPEGHEEIYALYQAVERRDDGDLALTVIR